VSERSRSERPPALLLWTVIGRVVPLQVGDRQDCDGHTEQHSGSHAPHQTNPERRDRDVRGLPPVSSRHLGDAGRGGIAAGHFDVVLGA
jgi:hypothetical protein